MCTVYVYYVYKYTHMHLYEEMCIFRCKIYMHMIQSICTFKNYVAKLQHMVSFLCICVYHIYIKQIYL